VADPEQVPNADALGTGMAEVRVAMTFVNGERLERFALYARTDDRVEKQGWGWRLTGEDGAVVAEGDDAAEFTEHAERLFPEACVHANLISGGSLDRVARGGASGPERAIQCSDTWCTSDLRIRCSMAATGLFMGMCPEAPVRTLGYDAEGRPELTIEGTLTPQQVQLAVLGHAIAFAGEGMGVCPLFLDDPLEARGPATARSCSRRSWTACRESRWSSCSLTRRTSTPSGHGKGGQGAGDTRCEEGSSARLFSMIGAVLCRVPTGPKIPGPPSVVRCLAGPGRKDSQMCSHPENQMATFLYHGILG
jgi:hypothetical protein